MNGQDSSHSTIIPWPAWDQPFHGTPRGYIATRETKWKPFVALLGCVFVSVTFIGFGLREVAIAMPISILTWLGVYVAKILPLRKVVAEARNQCRTWRQAWRAFEDQSAAFQRDVRCADCTEDDAFDRAPMLPAITWQVSNHVLKPLPDYVISSDMPHDMQIEFAQQNIARVLCEIARLGPDQA